MRQRRGAPPKKRPLLSERVLLRLSDSRRVDGLWIGSGAQNESEPYLRCVEEALRLIKVYDRVRYNHLIRDLERVWVRPLPGICGRFNYSLSACELDPRFLLAETSFPEGIAAVIVHEATHARLQRCGIGYGEDLRARVEAVCIRRELAFAAKLPNGEQVREQAERALELGATRGYWTDADFYKRERSGYIEMLRYVGLPDWLARTRMTFHTLRRSVIRFVRGLVIRNRT
jgi:hypothetical protein